MAPQRSRKTKIFNLNFFLRLGSVREGSTVSKEQKIKLDPKLFASLWNTSKHVNPFLPNVVFLHYLKHLETVRCRNAKLGTNGLRGLHNIFSRIKNVMRCAIWYYLYNLKNLKNTHGGVLIKINTPPWVFFTFFKLHKWYQIAQRTTNVKNYR